MNVLIVEDDKSLARLLQKAVSEMGCVTQVEADGLAALDRAQQVSFDMILLDVMLPGLEGQEVCRRLRAAGIATPILMITARDALEDIVEGLESGADDYLVKPVRIREMLARMQALLRRGFSAPTLLKVADLTLDSATRKARRGGKTILLSATEYSLLEYLMRNAGRVLTRSMILEHVWQYDFEGSDNVLDVYIGYLRRKIDRNHSSALIRTVRGAGFCLDADHDA